MRATINPPDAAASAVLSIPVVINNSPRSDPPGKKFYHETIIQN